MEDQGESASRQQASSRVVVEKAARLLGSSRVTLDKASSLTTASRRQQLAVLLMASRAAVPA